MGTRGERRAAQEAVARYHEEQLRVLIDHVAAVLDRFRAAEVDPYAVDVTIHHYHQAARELWKFCWSGGGGSHTEMVAGILDRMTADGETIECGSRFRGADESPQWSTQHGSIRLSDVNDSLPQ